MITEWRKFRGWVVLEYFLKDPNVLIHINELARELKISTQSANTYLKLYEKEKILTKKILGISCHYSINNHDERVKALKKFYTLQLLHESKFVENFKNQNSSVITLALYGSFANGEYSEQSDIDLIAISPNKKFEIELIKRLESIFKRSATLQILSIGEWRKMVKKDDDFALSVLKNHVILYGGNL